MCPQALLCNFPWNKIWLVGDLGLWQTNEKDTEKQSIRWPMLLNKARKCPQLWIVHNKRGITRWINLERQLELVIFPIFQVFNYWLLVLFECIIYNHFIHGMSTAHQLHNMFKKCYIELPLQKKIKGTGTVLHSWPLYNFKIRFFSFGFPV